MAQLNIKIDDRRLDALRRYARRRRTTVSWLLRDYIDYLLAGGTAAMIPGGEIPGATELAEVAQLGGALDWLAEEPELYSAEDGKAL